MPGPLTASEWADLSERFGLLRRDGPRPCRRSVRAADLLDRETREQYLDWLGGYIGSPSRRVTASTLVKRYAYLAVSPALYAMSVYNKELMLRLEHCFLETYADPEHNPGGTKLPHLRLADDRSTEPEPGRRDEWRERLVRELFAGHVAPMLRALAETARIPPVVLWENVVVRIVPLFEDALEQAGSRDAAGRIREDFRYLVREIPGELFGERRNPLSGLVDPAGLESGDGCRQRLRRTCCLYYEISAEYCRRCPLTGASGRS
ncbi:IucA/IucC family C-terminal-domain containing protein [Cohnella massiliensis]|uniref:IucA/IucC family C-terminal-domain containing protein n=1 Tax=Cohnella massiliensis TaxID=1816691 RepID=UPI0009BC1491|nr:IucA/IucC family C-terminal-domain containing protein [Cohnella massiliensis]